MDSSEGAGSRDDFNSSVRKGVGLIPGNERKLKPMPVMTSAPAPDFLAGWVRKNFGLGRAAGCSFWMSGLNLVYTVQDGSKKYALKIYRPWWRSPAQVDFELKELLFLRKAGLPVAAPIAAPKGKSWLPMRLPEGLAVAALFTFAGGEVRQKPVEPLAHKAGALLARLHQAQDRFPPAPPSPPLDAEFLTTVQMKKLARYRPSFGKQWPLLQRAAARLKRELSLLPQGSPFFGLIHGDFHYGNMHYDPSKKTYVLFDLELTARGWRLYDLATLLWDLWDDSPSIRPPEIRRGTKAFLKSYSALRALSPVETKALPAMIAARHLHWMGMQSDFAPYLSTYLVSAPVHRRKMEFLRKWMSGELVKKFWG